MAQAHIFSDFDIKLPVNDFTHDLGAKYNFASIKQSIGSLLQTAFYDRLFHPEIGQSITTLLFQPASPATFELAKDGIKHVLQWEPRIAIHRIDIYQPLKGDPSLVKVKIDYEITLLNLSDAYEFTVRRLK
jgi:phage baseplate assembly protein W